jgi:cobalt-zinc-cadmium efflux system membrane fusion protein
VICRAALVAYLLTGPGSLGCDASSNREAARNEAPGPGKEAREDEHTEGDGVSLTAAEIEEFGLRWAPAGPATLERRIELPGVVRANEDRVAHIVPRFAGVVTEVRKRIGDRVKSGEILAVIESSQSLSPYSLRTLLAGVIIEKHVTRGEAVTPASQAFVVADLETVWIDLSVYQRDLTRIHEGQDAVIMAGHGLPHSVGVVSYVTPVVDEGTRTAIARVVLDNPEGFWRPGMFVTAEVTIEHVQVEIAVPGAALHALEDQTVVFVREDGGFRPRPVRVGRRDDDWAEIEEGLVAGDRVVVQGGFTLKSELQRGELAGGHGH